MDGAGLDRSVTAMDDWSWAVVLSMVKGICPGEKDDKEAQLAEPRIF